MAYRPAAELPDLEDMEPFDLIRVFSPGREFCYDLKYSTRVFADLCAALEVANTSSRLYPGLIGAEGRYGEHVLISVLPGCTITVWTPKQLRRMREVQEAESLEAARLSGEGP